MLNSVPSKLQTIFSSAEVEKSMSCAETSISFSFSCNLTRLLAGLEKTETRFKAFRKEIRSIVTLKGFSCGITLL